MRDRPEKEASHSSQTARADDDQVRAHHVGGLDDLSSGVTGPDRHLCLQPRRGQRRRGAGRDSVRRLLLGCQERQGAIRRPVVVGRQPGCHDRHDVDGRVAGQGERSERLRRGIGMPGSVDGQDDPARRADRLAGDQHGAAVQPEERPGHAPQQECGHLAHPPRPENEEVRAQLFDQARDHLDRMTAPDDLGHRGLPLTEAGLALLDGPLRGGSSCCPGLLEQQRQVPAMLTPERPGRQRVRLGDGDEHDLVVPGEGQAGRVLERDERVV